MGEDAPSRQPARVPAPAAGTRELAGAAATTKVRAPVRDKYLDLLRAIALCRVVVFHTFYQAVWLSFFPSMGVMFALAGSLMARSLDQRPAAVVLRNRARRLLLPLWVYGVVVVGGLLLQGWRPASEPGGWWRLLTWLVPIADPAAPADIGGESGLLPSNWGFQSVEILWYIRAYFWFVLLSPFLLRTFRRWPLTTTLAPLLLVVALTPGVVNVTGIAEGPVWDFGTYGACWMLGFAHHDGLLRRLSARTVLVCGAGLMVLGLISALAHVHEYGWDITVDSLAQGSWSLGACLLLLRVSPSWAQLPPRLRFLDGAVTLINNRAVTIYLWHNFVLMLTVPLTDPLWDVPVLDSTVPWLLESPGLLLAAMVPLLAVLVMAVGWVEDVAARRPPRLWPSGPPRARATKR